MAAGEHDEIDGLVRAATFRFLGEQTQLYGDEIPWAVLSKGLDFRGTRVPLVGPQGIFKPAVLPHFPLTIATAPVRPGIPRPYDDGFLDDGTLRYRYRGTDPRHHENVGLRECMRRHIPLVYLHGVRKGLYLAAWPAYVIGEDPTSNSFQVDLDSREARVGSASAVAEPAIRRRYSEVTTLQRLHQQEFRSRVLLAYRESCALCNLRHRELLDAAHILPDADPRGEPAVPNGLALCKLHHAAFDQHLIGVRPDLVVEVRADILSESDGPMLLHGLQRIHGSTMAVPKRADQRPNPAHLQERYERFRRAS